jgi:hypothetical protein
MEEDHQQATVLQVGPLRRRIIRRPRMRVFLATVVNAVPLRVASVPRRSAAEL